MKAVATPSAESDAAYGGPACADGRAPAPSFAGVELCDQDIDRIYSYALHCLRDEKATYEAVAEAFFLAQAAVPPRGRDGKSRLMWLYRFAGDAIASRYRTGEPVPLWADSPAPAVDPAPLPDESGLSLRSAVAELPLYQRQELILHYGHGLSIEEVAWAIWRSAHDTALGVRHALRQIQLATSP